MQVTADGEGKTRVRERFVVSMPVAGAVARIELHPGDLVTPGTVVARIQPTGSPLLDVRTRLQGEARVKAARAATARAEATTAAAAAAHELARREWDRQRKLAASGATTTASLDAAELALGTRRAELASAHAATEAARFELEEANAALQQREGPAVAPPLEVRTPASGRVLRVVQENAGVLPAGSPLLEIGDPSDLEAVIDLVSSDAVRVAPGAEVRLEHWGGERPLLGHVRKLEPSGFTKVSALGVEEQRVNVVVDPASADAWRGLSDGYRVEARVVTWANSDVIKVPASALLRLDDRWTVFVVADGRARRRAVEIGHQNAVEAEVLRGIGAGDRVIVHPSDKVDEGVRIVPLREVAPPPESKEQLAGGPPS
jgi:HlyD family secretion protein